MDDCVIPLLDGHQEGKPKVMQLAGKVKYKKCLKEVWISVHRAASAI